MVTVNVEGKDYTINVPSARCPLSVFGMNSDNPKIVGISPWPSYTKELYDKLMVKITEYHENKEERYWKVQSSSNERAFYTVRVKDMNFMCTCPGYKYHDHCKHIDYIRRQFNLEVNKLNQTL